MNFTIASSADGMSQGIFFVLKLCIYGIPFAIGSQIGQNSTSRLSAFAISVGASLGMAFLGACALGEAFGEHFVFLLVTFGFATTVGAEFEWHYQAKQKAAERENYLREKRDRELRRMAEQKLKADQKRWLVRSRN